MTIKKLVQPTLYPIQDSKGWPSFS